MTSQTGKQTITIHILSDVSKSKSNQAWKLGHLTLYVPTAQNDKTHSNNSFECVLPFCEVGA